jgi:cell surface protein SprA
LLLSNKITFLFKNALIASATGFIVSEIPAEKTLPQNIGTNTTKINIVETPTPTVVIEDTNKVRTKSKYATYEEKDRYGDPFHNKKTKSSFVLKDPSNVKTIVELDTSGEYYNVYEKVGDNIDYKNPTMMTFEEYERFQRKQAAKNYWKSKQAGVEGEGPLASKRLIPKIYLPPEVDRIFGGNFIDLKPNGAVTLRFGGRWQRVDNPTLPLTAQRNGGFDFDQTIQMNVQGKIGEKLRLNINWDTKASFDFENNIKLQYTAFPEDIIQKIEAGNINFPLNSQLIQGSQQLFGVKTQLRFGRLMVTSVASNQRGKIEEIVINGGTQSRVNEIVASDYEDDRHFFLNHYFRDNYERALANLPLVNSPVNVTRVEVYVMNYARQVDNLRNIIAFTDLGETTPYATFNIPGGNFNNRFPDNTSNYLNNYVLKPAAQRSVQDLYAYGMQKGTHFESIERARKLKDSEFKMNKQLGYISLNTPLRAEELLAVSYEYTLNGRTYRVGELQDNYQNYDAENQVVLKLIKPTSVRRDMPVWDLMMKNVYNLGTSQISKDNFFLQIVYKDDLSGVDNPSLHEGKKTKNKLLLQLFGLDRLNNNNDPPADGNFDFIEGVTIDPQFGRIYFPVLEPFGSHLEKQFDSESEVDLIYKYVFDSLYATRRVQAKQSADKDKFFIKVRYQGGYSASEISIPGLNIQPGSVTVTAGGMRLIENQDYTVNYDIGRVKILNQGVLNSGKDIRIQYESTQAFLVRQKTMLGTRLDYKINDNLLFGGTLLYLNERPLIRRVAIGDEPIRNTMVGLDGTYRTDSKIITKIIDKIPGIQTKEMSNVAFTGEFAKLIPGASPFLGKGGQSYIDDFEGSEIVINLLTPNVNWKLASTPLPLQRRDAQVNPIRMGYDRAKLAWYVVDQSFYRGGGLKPDYITEDDLKNHYIRSIGPQEVFPNRQLQAAATNLPVLDLAFYPHERGMYNYNPNLTNRGFLTNPTQTWGGVSRAFTTDTDFDNANVQYIEFWMMDPFIQSENGKVLDGNFNSNNNTGGFLYFNLGNVSEDVLTNGKFEFENGLPEAINEQNNNLVDTTVWGIVTRKQFLNDAFSNSPGTRQYQDVGLEGLNDENERTFHQDYLNSLTGLSDSARQAINADPSGDNFKHFYSKELTDKNLPVQQLYKDFNGMEGNTPENANSGGIAQIGNTQPDKEDLNRDNTINDIEGYYEYKVPLAPGRIKVGLNYCVNQQTNIVNGDNVTWYQFRIPIRTPDKVVGSIDGFKTIRFMRMYMQGYQQPVVLRFAQLQMVANPWREFIGDLSDVRAQLAPEPVRDKVVVSTVNIEENGKTDGTVVPYKLPPGVQRDFDLTSVIQRQQNEQSLQICAQDVKDQHAVAAFKNINFDLQMYKRLKMYLHAQGTNVGDNEVNAFIRLGTDFTENYYEYEVPLKMTPVRGSNAEYTPDLIWLSENEMDVELEMFYDLKLERNSANISKIYPYTKVVNGDKIIKVVGNPDMSATRVIMIGIRNPKSDDGLPKSVCIWANELRVAEFQNKGGWAAVGSMNAKLADLANITASGKISTPGFGSINQKLQQRQRSTNTFFDIGANINLQKFIPEKTGIKIPMFVGYEQSNVIPQFNPIDPDIEMSRLRKSNDSIYDFVKNKVQEKTVRRSINFTNMHKVKTGKNAKSYLWDVENLSLTFAYSDLNKQNAFTEYNNTKNYKYGAAYNYNSKFKGFSPFEKMGIFNSPALKFIKDFNFNPMPTMIGLRVDFDRMFNETLYRNADLDTLGMTPFYNKAFTTTRSYDLKWTLTKSITLDYTAIANARIDEPFGKLDTQEKKDSVWNNVKSLGRPTNFQQNVAANYKLPFDKFPIVNWLNADVRYGATYRWTASSLALTQNDSLNLGNLVQNTRERSINGRINLESLYNKNKFLKSINQPPAKKTPVKKTILDDKKPQVGVPKGAEKEDTTKKKVPEYKILKGTLRIIMGVRSINFNYAINEGTTLPGYMGTANRFGMDTRSGQPGTAFILGDQFVPSPSKFAAFKQNADNTNLITRSDFLYQNMMYNRTENFTARTQVEPFKDFKVNLEAKITRTGNYQELFKNDTIPGSRRYISLSPMSTGSHTISFISFKTMFRKPSAGNVSPVFEEFLGHRANVKQRLNDENQVAKNFYSDNSQDVLIPAFVEIYTGRNLKKLNSPFYSFPLPNWRIDYAGLAKIEKLKKHFTSINLIHDYKATYGVGNYITSLQYQTPFTQGNYFFTQDPMLTYFPNQINDQGEIVPYNIINTVNITERFAPLIGIDIKTKKKININTEYRIERILLLNMTNLQLTETNNNDIIVGLGYTTNKFRVPFRIQGEIVTLKNDLTFRVDFAIRDSRVSQRTFEGINEYTNGLRSFQLKPNINYMVNQRLSIQLFFERTVNDPRITTSFKTRSTAGGIQVRFQLS